MQTFNDERLRRTSDVVFHRCGRRSYAVWTFSNSQESVENGKHVSREAFHIDNCASEELIELATGSDSRLWLTNVLFTGAVRRMSRFIDGGLLGDLYYYRFDPGEPGVVQHDVNVLWDLAPHDLSVMDYLIKRSPKRWWRRCNPPEQCGGMWLT